MAEIPTALPASAAQAAFHAREIAAASDAERAGQTDAARRHVRTVDEAGAVVDTEDADTRVFSDAEGHGSTGRSLDTADDTAEPTTEPSEGITTDTEGRVHLDLKA